MPPEARRKPNGPKGTPTLHVRPTRSLPHAVAGRTAHNALERAVPLVSLVRDEGPEALAKILDRCTTQDLYALVTVLAAMVPDDQPVHQLLGWLDDKTVLPVDRAAS